MKQTLRQSMAWLHTWAGLLSGWLLFAVFLTGTVSYYRLELSEWMRPELRAAVIEPAAATAVAARRLGEIAPGARQWTIDLPNARAPYPLIYFRKVPGGPSFGKEFLDPATGTPAQVRATLGGDGLFYFHFDLLMPSIWGRLIVGFAAIVMLVAIISGVITHKAIFRDFFTFRAGRGQRAWLDGHNAMGVLALPYHLLITYTGIITLLPLYMPWGIDAAYGGARPAFLQELGTVPAIPAAAGRPAALTNLDALVADAGRIWSGRSGRVIIDHPGDANARITVFRSRAETISHRAEWLLFDGVSGRILSADGTTGAAARTGAVLYGLHTARFTDHLLRGLLFLSGMAGTAVVATGLILWTVKRRSRLPDPTRPHFGFRLVERLNVGVVVGLPIGIAGHFWANRLLSLDLPDRAVSEINALFLVWVAAMVWATLRPSPRAWIELLWVAAVLYICLPVVSALTTDRHLGVSLPSGDWLFAGMDMAFLVAGVGFTAVALKLRRRPTGTP